jgi:hypothetical protein
VPASVVVVVAVATGSASVVSAACSFRSVARVRFDAGIHDAFFSTNPLLSYYSALFLLRFLHLPMFGFSSAPISMHWLMWSICCLVVLQVGLKIFQCPSCWICCP